nr:MAG TPA: C2H2 type zinc-finger protein [Caudoviricetes sp.]
MIIFASYLINVPCENCRKFFLIRYTIKKALGLHTVHFQCFLFFYILYVVSARNLGHKVKRLE